MSINCTCNELSWRNRVNIESLGGLILVMTYSMNYETDLARELEIESHPFVFKPLLPSQDFNPVTMKQEFALRKHSSNFCNMIRARTSPKYTLLMKVRSEEQFFSILNKLELLFYSLSNGRGILMR